MVRIGLQREKSVKDLDWAGSKGIAVPTVLLTEMSFLSRGVSVSGKDVAEVFGANDVL